MNNTRYCAYCRMHKSGEGFRTTIHHASGTPRGMCPSCQDTRKRPREELEALAVRERAERRGEFND